MTQRLCLWMYELCDEVVNGDCLFIVSAAA